MMLIFQIVFIAIIVVFYTAYFTKSLLLRKKGIKTDRLGKGDKPKSVRGLEAVLKTVTFVLPVIQVLSVLSDNRIMPLSFPSLLVLKVAGGIIAVVGIIYFITALVDMKESWRAGIDASQKTDLIKSGIYRMSRNPAFVGFDLFYIGTALSYPNILIIIFTVAGVILLHLQILQEERYLLSVFGKEYEDYKRGTLRY